MYRELTAAFETALSYLDLPALKTLIELEGEGRRFTDYAQPITFAGQRYEATPYVVRNLSENLLLRVPTPELILGSMDASEQARDAGEEFIEEFVTFRVVYLDAGTWLDSGYFTRFLCDKTFPGPNAVRLRLSTSDAARGYLVPRLSTRTEGCQRVFRQGGCHFRPAMLQGAAYPTDDLATKCDHSLSGPLGCIAHFPDLDARGNPWRDGVSTGDRVVQPKPYLAMPAAIDRLSVGTAR